MNLYGLIGFPLNHSFSPVYFEEKFRREKIRDCSYQLYPIRNAGEITDLAILNPNLKGLNVTLPHKESVMAFLDKIDPEAQETGAVNTIVIHREAGKIMLEGFNTDVTGFEALLEEAAPFKGRALILGTGGASKAVVRVFEKKTIEFDKASISGAPGSISYPEANKQLHTYATIVNTTPLGMYPDEDSFPALDYSKMHKDQLLIDLVYNPANTRFLQLGRNSGAKVAGGLKMLQVQAEASWKIWMQATKK